MNQRPLNQKIFFYLWLALTVFYLLLRYQNIPGVFSEYGIITVDTDPFYRLHRIQSIISGSWIYPLFDPMINFPDGWEVAWPMGLDYLIAIPLKILGIHDHGAIMTLSFLSIPIFMLPVLFLSASVTTKMSQQPWLGLIAGLGISCSSVILQQTNVGRLDHHGFEILFLLLNLWFLLRCKSHWTPTIRNLWVLVMGLSPSMFPHAWLPIVFLCMACLVEKEYALLKKINQIFFLAFWVSLIPLFLSDRFWTGSLFVAGFSWWSSLILLLASVVSSLWIGWKERAWFKQHSFWIQSAILFAVFIFLAIKNGFGFFGNQLEEGVSFVFVKKNTLATTTEMKSPFIFDWDFLGEKILLWVIPFVYLWFLYRRKYGQVLVYCFFPIVLAYTQIRFMPMGSSLMIVLIVLAVWDVSQKFHAPIKLQMGVSLLSTILISMVYMPHLGLTKSVTDSPYFRPVRDASIFLKNKMSLDHENQKNLSVLAMWDYGHWILYYSGLPVISTPFQGQRAQQVNELFVSEDAQSLEAFTKKIPTKYLMVDQFPGRFYNILEYAGKNPENYFDFGKKQDGTYTKMVAKPAFDHVMYQRFLKNDGADDEGNFPDHWRLIYSSPYTAQYSKTLPALKVFEHVPGAIIQIKSKLNPLWLQIELDEGENKKIIKKHSTLKGDHLHQWTVPYSQYDQGGIRCNGMYQIVDQQDHVIGILPPVTQENVIKGTVLIAH